MKRTLLSIAIALLAALSLAACGGNGGSEEDANGERGPVELTDPGEAPTTEPIEDGQVYVIRDNNVTAPGGASTTVPDRGSIPLDGGEDDSDSNGDGGGDGDSGTGVYAVQPGDTCSAISSSTGATIDELLELNPSINSDCSNLTPGENLRVPRDASGADDSEDTGDDDGDGEDTGDDGSDADEEPTEPADDDSDSADENGGDGGGSGQTYEIQPGDICGTIADQFGVDVDELVALNGLNCNNLQVGETIQIPE